MKLAFGAVGASGLGGEAPPVKMRVEPSQVTCEVGATGRTARFAQAPGRSSHAGDVQIRIDPSLRVAAKTLKVAGRRVDRREDAVTLRAEYGLNRVPIDAGAGRTSTCEFLGGPQVLAADAWIEDAVTLQLAAEVVDDGSRIGPMRSLADAVEARLEGGELAQRLEQLIPHPLSDYEECRREVMGRCVLRVGATASNVEIQDVDVRLRPRDGELEVELALENVEVDLELFARAAGVLVSSRGTVSIATIELEGSVAVDVADGHLRASVTQPPSIELEGLTSQFEGIDGAILERALDVVEPRLRRAVEAAAAGRLEPVADSAVSLLVGRSGQMSWKRPLLPGARGSEALLQLDVALSKLDVRTWGLELTFDMRVTSKNPPRHDPVGVVSTMPRAAQRPTWSSVSLAMNLAVANQALHALWQAGVFDHELPGSVLGPEVPEDAVLQIHPKLPPMLVATGKDRVQLQLGDWALTLRAPGLFERPIRAELHARTSFELHARGSRLVRGPLRHETLSIEILDQGVGALAARMFRPWIRKIVNQAADRAARLVPASAPLPAFTVPNVASSTTTDRWWVQLSLPHISFEEQHSIFTGSLRPVRAAQR